MSASLIAVDPALLMLLVIRIAILADAVEAARAAVVAEQESHAAYRLANPQKREAA